ncbi:hypothetical protein ACHAXR_005617 [Thalassiosira sp. AJA248-18]
MIVATSTGIGENSSDDCCVCGDEWSEGQQGWVLCDSNGCENTVCPKCTTSLSLSVSELFYCPICAGSGQSAAAAVGGAVATAVAACAELEKLPVSFKTTQKILTNLLQKPDDPKYRKLRLENKNVKQLVDLDPVLNILTSVGFVRKQCPRQIETKKQDANNNANPAPTEEVLLLEGPVPTAQVNELLEILNGLTPEGNNGNSDGCNENKSNKTNPPSSETIEKRKSSAATEESTPNKKPKVDEEDTDE